eukprot:SAG31_NODE_5939_length_2249_cov_1.644186_3_plen_153_part_00
MGYTREEWISMAEAAGFPTILKNSPTRTSAPPQSPYSPSSKKSGSKTNKRSGSTGSTRTSSSGQKKSGSHFGSNNHNASSGSLHSGHAWDARPPILRSRLYSSVDKKDPGVRSMVPGRHHIVGGQIKPVSRGTHACMHAYMLAFSSETFQVE